MAEFRTKIVGYEHTQDNETFIYVSKVPASSKRLMVITGQIETANRERASVVLAPCHTVGKASQFYGFAFLIEDCPHQITLEGATLVLKD